MRRLPMVFSTPIFLFCFLVLTLFVYYLVPRRLRNPVLLLSSLFFYYWGERIFVLIMLLSTAIDYTHGLMVERCQKNGNDKGARWAVASSVRRLSRRLRQPPPMMCRTSTGRGSRAFSCAMPER